MDRRWLALFLLIGLTPAQAQVGVDRRPNFILILTDGLGWGDLGAHELPPYPQEPGDPPIHDRLWEIVGGQTVGSTETGSCHLGAGSLHFWACCWSETPTPARGRAVRAPGRGSPSDS